MKAVFLMSIGMLIFLLDLALKIALGYFVVWLIWLPVQWACNIDFGNGWILAAALLGMCIVGFFDGCDFILNGMRKRIDR